jgi:deoxyadenosine/deoxycytidine kinase
VKNTHIVVSGTIAAGKSTATRLIAEHLELPMFLERYSANPYLVKYYAEPTRWALASQLWFLMHCQESEEAIQLGRGGVQDHSAVEVHRGFDVELLNEGLLDEDSYDLLERVYVQGRRCKKPPDLVVYLQASPATLIRRIQYRGREFEASLTVDFLQRLATRKLNSLRAEGAPILVVNTEVDDLTATVGAKRFMDLMRSALL